MRWKEGSLRDIGTMLKRFRRACMNEVSIIKKHFDFLLDKGFKRSIIKNRLEKVVSYEKKSIDISITYDIRVGNISVDLINTIDDYAYLPPNYISVTKSDFFSSLDRELLLKEEKNFKSSNDKNIDSLITAYANFIKSHINEIENLANGEWNNF